jgi:hypothetical protein
MLDDDSEMEGIWKQAHSLSEFLAPDNFKSYDELKGKMVKVLGVGTAAAARATAVVEEDTPWNEAPAPELKAAATPKFDEDEDDMDSFFDKLNK